MVELCAFPQQHLAWAEGRLQDLLGLDFSRKMRLKVGACEGMVQVVGCEVWAGQAANEGFRGPGMPVMLRSKWSRSEDRKEPHSKWNAVWGWTVRL